MRDWSWYPKTSLQNPALLYTCRERVEVHESVRREVERRVEGIQEQIYKEVYTSIVNFVKTSQVSDCVGLK